MRNARGFSLIELLLAVLITSMGIMVLLQAVSLSTNRMDRVRKDIVATNLAREGVEAIYNIRDSNRQRRAEHDGCWLKIDPLVDTNLAGCLDDAWFTPGWYTIRNGTLETPPPAPPTPPKQTTRDYRRAAPVTQALSIRDTNGVDNEDPQYILCQDDNDRRYSCPGTQPSATNTVEGRFFRGVEVKELRNKQNSNLLSCDKGATTNCNTSTPKELVFCVHVEYLGSGIGHKELCASMTNFLK